MKKNNSKLCFLLFFCFNTFFVYVFLLYKLFPDVGSISRGLMDMTFVATDESLNQHKVPEWYEDAKLGIFIHWGLYSVPGFAETSLNFGDMNNNNQVRKKEWNHWFKHNAYAEWYANTVRIDGSTAQKYHEETYGKEFQYNDFVPIFNKAVKKWDPEKMTNLFKEIHAQYIVLTSKHHDGFLMWPSRTLNPNKRGFHSKRNIVGEMGDAVRRKGMHMGYYYSGGVDWTFNSHLIQQKENIMESCVQSNSYVKYANSHWRELIDVYNSSILWNDICYPSNSNAKLNEMFAYFYNKNPNGIINDRFVQYHDGNKRQYQHDLTTPEYKKFPDIQTKKWESCRGIGHSFGYNKLENDDDYISIEKLIHLLVDIVSKNGNLLLNVGPKADGTIPDIQEKRLRGLGQWLDKNGEAIFKTRPWIRAEGTTNDGSHLRFTQNDKAIYITFLTTPSFQKNVIRDLNIEVGSHVTLLGHSGYVGWENVGSDVLITLPIDIEDQPAFCIKILLKTTSQQ